MGNEHKVTQQNDESNTADPLGQCQKVIIYTDGAAEPNPGPGGYGVVLIAGQHRKELSAGFLKTTNNRMELLGVIAALEALTRPCRVVLFSDSKYVVDSVTRGSVLRWKKKNWFRAPGERAKNVDLWKRFLDVSKNHEVEFRWVKGHAGIAENERCDELAVAAAQGYELAPDAGYIEELKLSAEAKGILTSMDSSTSIPLGSETASSLGERVQGDPNTKHEAEGEPCRKCGTALVKKATKQQTRKPGQSYYYEWYLRCPGCNTMYMVDAAKRMIQ
ncbi:MAG: ribonuclease HI [Planctomycetes bacterium]|nr:ribonuclease HI [Planctomycetota bacterium]